MTETWPQPAETCPGTTLLSARITVSAKPLPGQNLAIVGAGKIGLARQPYGAMIVIGAISPVFCVVVPWWTESAQSTGKHTRSRG